MSTWMEYVVAVVLASFVALTLFAVQLRTQETSVDSTQYRAAKKSAVDVVRMIEHDFKNLGSQHPASPTSGLHALPGGATFGIASAPDTTGSPRSFQFYAPSQRGQAPRVIRYEWETDGSVTLSDGTTRDTYRFTRTVDGTVDGRSTGTLTQLSFNLLEGAGNAITNVGNTRQIFVELRAISPLGKGSTIEETRWTGTYRPLALTIDP